MSHNKRPFQASIDIHAYQPLHVNESCLSDEECGEAVLDAVNCPGDWTSYLTTEELKELEDAASWKSPFYPHGQSRAGQEKTYELSRRGMLRAYARWKYANGAAVWCGDGVPFQRNSG